MNEQSTAYFLYRPRRISDLSVPHPLEKERRFHVVGEVSLPFIDFENFSEDLLADRAFLDRYNGPLSVDGVYQCLLVSCPTVRERILAVPKDGFVYQAAVLLP